MEKDFSWIKKGAKVLWEDKEHEITSDVYDCLGNKIESPEKNGWYDEVELENGESVSLCNLEPFRHISDLSFEELKLLRGEVYVGSIYVSHYRNSFGVPCKEVFDYCDGFVEDTVCEYPDYEKQEEILSNPEEFANYCLSVENYV